MEIFLNTTNLLMMFWLGFTIVCLALIVRSSLEFSRKMLIVPLTFLAFYVTINNTINLLGLPYDGRPVGEFTFITHKVVTNKDHTKHILFWVSQGFEHRMYRIPYTKESKQKMQAAERKSKKGIAQLGKFAKPTNSLFDDGPKADFKMYDFPLQKLIPKTK